MGYTYLYHDAWTDKRYRHSIYPPYTLAQPFIFPVARAANALAVGKYKTRNGMETEVIVVQYGCECWTHGQKFALIRTVCLCVRTLISGSVTATKMGQAPTESHVKHIKLLR